MERKIKLVQIGCGKMSKLILQYATNLNCEIVGAVDTNPALIGTDVGLVFGNTEIGVKVTDNKDLEKVLKKTKPDIAVLTTMSLLNDCEYALRICAQNGVNTITTCEEAFFSQNSNPNLWEEINRLAKCTNCTIVGSGYQDIFWGNLISNLAASTTQITKIKGSSSYNVEDYGIALADAHGAGFTKERFESEIASVDNISTSERNTLIQNREFMASYMWNVVGWLGDKLNLNIIEMSQKCVPIMTEEDLHSETLQMDVKSGFVRGMSAVVKASTKEGIEIEAECIGKIYTSTEFDQNEWTVSGSPTTTMVISKPCTAELTCADVVNRIPDVINAESGFIPTSKLSEPSYKHQDLNLYVQKEQ